MPVLPNFKNKYVLGILSSTSSNYKLNRSAQNLKLQFLSIEVKLNSVCRVISWLNYIL